MTAINKLDGLHAPVAHGEDWLQAAEICAYNSELRDKNGFIGDRGSKRAFRAIVERARAEVRTKSWDPLGAKPTADFSKKAFDRLLTKGRPEAAGLLLGAIEAFAGELATIVGRLMRTSGGRGVERIAIGGGLRASRTGELAIGRASLLVRAAGHDVELRPIRHHPDEAGLVGATQLVPEGQLSTFDSLLAIDIGGTNMRVGLVELNLDRGPDFSAAHVMGLDVWRHRDERPTREQAVAHLCRMLTELARRAAKEKRRLAPFVGVGVPGLVRNDGVIERGAQNLPGQWEGTGFSLADRIRTALPAIDGLATTVVLHNDAVVQGLSETPWMRDVHRWGVLTIGTGLGNASFRNRSPAEA